MKNTIVFCIFLNLQIFSQSITQYGWEWLNPKPTHASLHDIKFTDLNTGFCIGGNGTVLKTTNGGMNWLFLEIWRQPGFNDYRLMYVYNKDTLFIAGTAGYIFRSVNGGINWSAVSTGTQESIYGMYFRNSMTGYAAGTNSTLLKTTNGGSTWQQVPFNYNLSLSGVSFPDNNNGYLTGQKFAKTTNGGVSWDTSSVITGGNCIYFLNASTGFIGGNSIYMTTNSGISWNKFSNSANNIRSISFINSNTGYVNADNVILRTTNGGFNWSYVSSNQGSGLSFVDTLNGYACTADSYSGIIRRTSNGGDGWYNLNSRFESGDIYALYFVNENTGYYGGTSGILGKTTNGGLSWINILNVSGFIESIHFINENTGYVGQSSGSTGGIIRKTTNAGLNWSSYGLVSPVNAIMFADANTGYALGVRNVIYKTTNAGLNWGGAAVYSTWINGLYVLNANTVMAVGSYTSGNSYGFVAKTTDGGNNWTSNNYNWGSDGNSVWFTDMNTGYVACGISGYGGRVLKTTNFGETWNTTVIGNSYSLNTVQFFDANTGIVSGYNGTAAITTNAGMNWSMFYSVTDYHFFTMHCLNRNTCYFGGWYDIMMKISTGGVLVGNGNQNSILIKDHKLNQNYPNPFNPGTRIKFNISGTSPALTFLTVYDILGREVAVLVDEELNPGSYEINWDASNYPSGVYLYKLTSGNFTETRKMVLLK